MRFIPALVASIVLSAGLAQAENHVSADTVVATVGDTDITLGHMIVLKSRLPREYQDLPPAIIFEGVMDQLVQQTLLGELVDELSPGSRAVLDNEARALRASEAILEIGDTAVTEAAVEAAYAEMVETQSGEKEWNVDHILFQPQDGEEEGASKAKAEQVIADLDAGADFAELARERSTGPSGPGGGALGWAARGAFVPEFEEAMIALEPGTYSSEPVESRFGWHVIRVNEVRALEAPAMEDIRQQLEETVRRAAIDAAIAEVEAKTEVSRKSADDIDPSLLNNVDLLQK
jgi:peptidyl-prolyl cis-trans isomerase C